MASEAGDDSGALSANSGTIVTVILCCFAAIAAFASIAERLGAPPSGVIAALSAAAAAVVALMGWSARTSHPAQFYTAQGKLSPFVNALAGLAGWLALPAFAGLAGVFFSFGFDGLAFAAGPMAGLFLAGVLVSPYLAASKASTIPDFLGLRFGTTARLLSALVIAGVSFVVFAGALSSAASLGALAFGIPRPMAAGATMLLLAVSLLPGGMNGLTWSGVVTALVVLIGLGVASAGIALEGFGHPLPPLASAQGLQTISGLEISMIEKGFAEAATLKPHAKPFLQIDSANFFGLIFSLMAATAALPHLLQRSLSVPSVAAARTSTAWLLGLTLVMLMLASAWAVAGKQELYAMIERGTPFASLPEWMGPKAPHESVRIHGLSLSLVEDVIATVQSGAKSVPQVTDALNDQNPSSAAAWAALKDPLKALLLDVAKSAPSEDTSQYAWVALREKLLPAAALAAGNKIGMVTLGSLKIDAEAVMQDLPRILGQSATTTGVALAAALFGTLAIAGAALFNAAAVLARDLYPGVRDPEPGIVNIPRTAHMNGARVLIVVLGCAGAAMAMFATIDWTALAAPVLSAAAATLLPVLVIGIWWPRANGLGAVLAMLTGLTVALTYGLATTYFPVAFYDVWPAASDALPAILNKFAAVKAALATAHGDQAASLEAARDALARGTPFKPGVANWAGMGSACALVFALPVAFIMLGLGSLLGPRPSQAQRDFVALIRSPVPREPAAIAASNKA